MTLSSTSFPILLVLLEVYPPRQVFQPPRRKQKHPKFFPMRKTIYYEEEPGDGEARKDPSTYFFPLEVNRVQLGPGHYITISEGRPL